MKLAWNEIVAVSLFRVLISIGSPPHKLILFRIMNGFPQTPLTVQPVFLAVS
jgi:hypothetical protein